MSVGEIVDIVLSILSFLLAAISVVTVIITLKQNKKMIENNSLQLKEMQEEYRLSIQPLLEFQNVGFCLDRPRFSIHLQRMNTLFCRDIVLKRS